ncbi:septum formation initiator family protein [Mycobacterium sp.]|uniref:FtsB family cell division protein n=1 Tax=Mycobacterium sp. TaxID=1785 RepID=UPI0031D613A5
MPESKRPEPKRRSPSRPGRAGDSVAGRPRKSPAGRRGPSASPRAMPEVVEPIKQKIAESAEQRSDQRLGLTARRAAILATVVCVLTLTIAGPVRTYFAQRTEMEQLAASEAALRQQISDLEQQKGKLRDPAFIAAQARERLGFVMPGEIPYQVQLPPGAALPVDPGAQPKTAVSNEPWYTSLWHTIADSPHGSPAPVAPPPPGPPPPGPPPPGG